MERSRRGRRHAMLLVLFAHVQATEDAPTELAWKKGDRLKIREGRKLVDFRDNTWESGQPEWVGTIIRERADIASGPGVGIEYEDSSGVHTTIVPFKELEKCIKLEDPQTPDTRELQEIIKSIVKGALARVKLEKCRATLRAMGDDWKAQEPWRSSPEAWKEHQANKAKAQQEAASQEPLAKKQREKPQKLSYRSQEIRAVDNYRRELAKLFTEDEAAHQRFPVEDNPLNDNLDGVARLFDQTSTTDEHRVIQPVPSLAGNDVPSPPPAQPNEPPSKPPESPSNSLTPVIPPKGKPSKGKPPKGKPDPHKATSTPPGASTIPPSNTGKESSTSTWKIVLAVLGGVLVVGLITTFIYYYYPRMVALFDNQNWADPELVSDTLV